VCQSGSFVLQSPLTDGMSYIYQWERSFDGGTSWSATGSDAPELTISNPNSGITYRLAYAADAGCLADVNCRSLTSATAFVGTTALTTAGNHETTLRTEAGCDSIVRTFLQILPAYSDRFFVDLCPGESFRGLTLTSDTIITESFSAVSGCDSSATYEISVALEVDGEFATYAWSTGNNGDDAPVSTPGTYTLTLTDFNGCQLELTHNLAVTELAVDAITTPSACPGSNSGAVALLGTGDADLLYSIDGGDSFQPDATFSGLAPGTYDLVVENIDGCQASSTATVDDAPELNIFGSLPSEQTIERGDSVFADFTADFAVTEWRWNNQAFTSCNDCPATMLVPTVDTRFIIEAIAPGGCSVVDSFLIRVKDNRRFYAPTAFSPNGDDQNDVWRLFTGPRVEAITGLQIADRWGGIRYQQTTDLSPAEAGWDGNEQGSGQPLPPGTYVWSAGLRFSDGSSQVVRGQITLMR